MKKIIYIASIFSLALTFFACNSDSFEQVVTFDVPKEKARLVVSCEYLNNSDTLQVFISSSWNASDTALPTSKMDNCKVELYEGTQKIIDVPYKLTQIGYGSNFSGQSSNNVQQGYYVAKMNGALSEKEVYTLKVSAAGFETVEAKSIVPQLINIKKVTFKKNGFKSLGGGGFGGGSTKDLFAVEFDDPTGENYYNIECIEYQRDTVTKKLYQARKTFSTNQKFNTDIFNDDSDYNRSLLFTDNLFNGKTFIFKMGVETGYREYFNNPDPVSNNNYKIEGYDIRLYSMSKERFIFNNSLEDFYNNEGNPFGEPVPLYTNFDKGFGLFSFLGGSNFYVKIK